MPSPEKFRETLVEYKVSDEIICKIQDGFESITSKSKKNIKAEYFNQALSVMERELGIDKTREIFEANGCCKTGVRLKASKEFARINTGKSMQEKLEKIRNAPYLNMGSPSLNENGDLVVRAVNYYVDGKYLCACPTINKQQNQPKNRNYCYCCAGHFRFHYEIMLECKLNVSEIVSSPLDSDGEKSCVIRFSQC